MNDHRNGRARGTALCMLVVTVATIIAVGAAAAGDVTPEAEYSKYVDKHRTLQPLGDALFGEQVNLRDGGVQFHVVDDEISGTGLPLRIVRSFRLNELGKARETSGNTLGDWELEIPRLKTLTAAQPGSSATSPFGWQVPGTNKIARCSGFASPGMVTFSDPTRRWQASEWWNGYQFVDLAGTSHEILKADSSWPSGGTAAGISTGNVKLTCLSSTANGEPGEAFLATTPDGTRYWLDYLVYTPADTLNKPLNSLPLPDIRFDGGQGARSSPFAAIQDELKRRFGSLLATRIEDRFGNWLIFQYSGGLLTQVDASDGRRLTVTRSPTAVSVALGSAFTTRTWVYGINSSGSLVSAQQPDGRAWSYVFSSLASAPSLAVYGDRYGTCSFLLSDTSGPGSLQGTATAPSGASVTYSFGVRHFGRSRVPLECWGGQPGSPDTGFALQPADWIAFALVSRTVSGPGIGSGTWQYDYSPANPSWSTQCTGGCAGEVWTDVTAPDGTRTRSVFSNRFDETENLLLREDTYSAAGALRRRVEHQYATVAYPAPSPYPWPVAVGTDLQPRTNHERSERWAPTRQRTTLQDGSTFVWKVPATCGSSANAPCFDALARPTRITREATP